MKKVNTLVIGTGASGLAAALRLHAEGVTDLLVVSEGLNRGTSINTGSDKRTLVCKADALEMIQGDNTLRHVIQHGIQLKSFSVCNTDMTMNVCIQLIDLVENGKELRFTHIGLDL